MNACNIMGTVVMEMRVMGIHLLNFPLHPLGLNLRGITLTFMRRVDHRF